MLAQSLLSGRLQQKSTIHWKSFCPHLKQHFDVLRQFLIDVGCVFLFLYMTAASIWKARGLDLVKSK